MRGPRPPAPAPAPEAAWGEDSLFPVPGVGFGSVLDSVVSGPGEGFVLITLVSYVLFCCSLMYQCQEGGRKACSPNKLSHSNADGWPWLRGPSPFFLCDWPASCYSRQQTPSSSQVNRCLPLLEPGGCQLGRHMEGPPLPCFPPPPHWNRITHRGLWAGSPMSLSPRA
uniref:Uncharacterized protein n=1 Tax=Myotis myotis TaxID=51298 RepID=A0A7J7Z5X0_MYOMY|nr:hypothetical protein mMyoMyo1_010763 [Myotis myotis]